MSTMFRSETSSEIVVRDYIEEDSIFPGENFFVGFEATPGKLPTFRASVSVHPSLGYGRHPKPEYILWDSRKRTHFPKLSCTDDEPR